MTDASHEKRSRLRQTLATLQAELADGPIRTRGIGDGAQGLMSALLEEIDQTVLRRDVAFVTEIGERLVLEVAERRIVSVKSLPTALEGQFSRLRDRPLSENDQVLLSHMLVAFCENEPRLRVSAHLPEVKSSAGHGLSARVLRQAVAPGLGAQKTTRVENALRACAQHAISLVALRDGARVFQTGKATLIDALAAALSSDSEPQFAEPSVTLWQGALGEGSAVIRATLGSTSIMVLSTSEEMLACFSIWHALVAPR